MSDGGDLVPRAVQRLYDHKPPVDSCVALMQRHQDLINKLRSMIAFELERGRVSVEFAHEFLDVLDSSKQ
jgi:hypothetical protein